MIRLRKLGTNASWIILFALFILVSCKKDKSDKENSKVPACAVQLFDGDHFKDVNIVVKGPGEFSSLKNLPGAKKDWNDEADSFKAGENATVTFWTQPDFKGDSVVYEPETEKPSIDEPSSMKIRCNGEE